MSIAIVTGSSGLIGSETTRFFHEKGFDVIGIDNNLREYFFGPKASVQWNAQKLRSELRNFVHLNVDIRDNTRLEAVFRESGKQIAVIVHTAAQPSHDWAAKEPHTDFGVNANGTLNLLELYRRYCPEAIFVFTSTNKVYGDTPNRLPLVEKGTRWEIDSSHRFFAHGIDESMSIDGSKHSLFGVSKLSADILVQEYGRYFGLKTGVFRGGCLTGPAHSGAELHGFLAYIVQCAQSGLEYKIYGYGGKQVRDNIHAYDLVNAFWHFFQNPKSGAYYNIGGSRHSHCSVLEAISKIETLSRKRIQYTLTDQARSGDHIWWVSDVRKFQADYPQWKYRYDLDGILEEMVDEMGRRAAA